MTDSFFLLLNKTIGITSQQCLNMLKKKFAYKKVGHHGTLDPFASGLLLVGVGEATKFFPYVDDSHKTYVAELKLGEQTDSMDLTGTVISTQEIPTLDRPAVVKVLKNLTGKIMQTPPMFSAIKKDGVPLYKLARRGEEIERPPREVSIDRLELLQFTPPILQFEAVVSRGTYIRVLGEEIAQALGTVGHLVKLTRTRLVGKNLSEAMDPEKNRPCPIPIWKILSHIPRVSVSEGQARLFQNGQSLGNFLFSAEEQNSQQCQENEVFQRARQVLIFCQNKFLGVGLLQPQGLLSPQRLISSH